MALDATILGAQVLARADAFALPALLDAIELCFPSHRVRFASRAHHQSSTQLVSRAWLEHDAVWVELSVGLKSASSPLPAYLRALLDDPAVDPSFLRLIEWIDDALLRPEAFAFRPERAWRSSSELVALRASLLRATPQRSLQTVSWVLGAVYPELTVRVRRARLPSAVRVDQARLDFAVLDRSTLGEYGVGRIDGVQAVLSATDVAWPSREWTLEAQRRWSAVDAALEGSRLRLRVTLDCEQPVAPAVLGGPLGLDAVALSETRPAAVVLFDGSFDGDARAASAY